MTHFHIFQLAFELPEAFARPAKQRFVLRPSLNRKLKRADGTSIFGALVGWC